MEKTALILSTAFITTKPGFFQSELRIWQYNQGFRQIEELVKHYPQLDVFWVDNTVEDKDSVDGRLLTVLRQIPNLKSEIAFFDNDMGRQNKGAGLIIQWRKIFSEISFEGYSYIIHYEPRQKLFNYSFFERFFHNPGNYVKIMRAWILRRRIVPWHVTVAATGLLVFETKLLRAYAASVNLDKIVKKRISIEKDLYEYLRRHKIPYTEVQSLGLLWHNTANGENIRF